MASAIKRMAYCDLTLVPHITRKPKRDIDELKQRLIDTWDRIPQGIIDEAIDQRQTLLRTCVKGKGLHFEQLLWSNHTTGSCQSHFRHSRSLKPSPNERACAISWIMATVSDVGGPTYIAKCNKKFSCRRDAARCFMSLNFSLSHSRSFEVTPLSIPY